MCRFNCSKVLRGPDKPICSLRDREGKVNSQSQVVEIREVWILCMFFWMDYKKKGFVRRFWFFITKIASLLKHGEKETNNSFFNLATCGIRSWRKFALSDGVRLIVKKKKKHNLGRNMIPVLEVYSDP